VREYLAALDAGNPAHDGGAKYLSPTDPAAAWNTKEGRGKFGYFTNYLIDTEHAVVVDVEATPARMAQEIKATKAMAFTWELVDGEGTLHGVSDQEVEYRAPAVPGLARLKVTVTQRDVTVTAEALITVTDSLESAITPAVVNSRGLPGYTFERAAGELWRCRFDAERNIIVVNSGHRDFVFATRNRALQLRYLVRLYVKELVLKNFAGLPADQLLERMIELSLYAEEKLKSG
jgi:hypothetical protein